MMCETSLARINWLARNFGARNNLVSVFHPISPDPYFQCEGAGGARLAIGIPTLIRK